MQEAPNSGSFDRRREDWVSNEFVSFIIPVFNGEKFVCDAVDSCLGQTWPDVEVVVTDDGSTDSTLEALNRAYRGNPRVKLFSFPKNRGKVAAYNHCYRESSGGYIAVLDADDLSVPDRAAVSIEALERHRAVMVCGDAIRFGDGIAGEERLAREWFGLDRDADLDFDSLLKRPKVLGPTVFAGREICGAIFPMDERMSHQDWWMPLAAASRGTVRHLDRPLVRYRLHGANTSRVNPSLGFDRWLDLTTREIFYYEQVLARFDLTRGQDDFCRCRIRMFQLLQEKDSFKRWQEGFSGAGLALGPGVPLRERMKYFAAMASPGLSFRASRALAGLRRGA